MVAGGFFNRQPGQHQIHVTPTQVQGTRAGQLALFVCYDSPVTCVSDHPEHIRGQAGSDFLKIVPTVWDETRVLSGIIGEHLVMARRSGDAWFVGAMNNDHTRVCDTSLAFLGAGRWKARWWHDARNSDNAAENLEFEERTVTAADTLHLRLSPGGGAVLQLVREP